MSPDRPTDRPTDIAISRAPMELKISERGVSQKIILIKGEGGQPKDYVDYGGRGESAKRLCLITGGGDPDSSEIGLCNL